MAPKIRALIWAGGVMGTQIIISNGSNNGFAAEPPQISSPEWTHVATFAYPGGAMDQSGLSGTDPSGVPEALLGGFGSGIDFDPKSNTLVSICDRGPFDGVSAFKCRVQIFTMRERPQDGAAGFTFANTKTVMLTSSAGESFVGSLDKSAPGLIGPKGHEATKLPPRLDPEAIRVASDGTWWISEEYGPWIDQFGSDGKHLRRIELPKRYRVQHAGNTYESELPPSNTQGRQPNRGLEGLAISSDGKTLYTMTQSPLIQDAGLDASNKRDGLLIRLLAIRVEDGVEPVFREYLYQLDDKRNGINELLVTGENELLVLERDGIKGAKAKCRRVYRVDMSETSEAESQALAKIDALPVRGAVAGAKPLTKLLELDLLDEKHQLAGEEMPEKIEGLSFGPPLADGRRTLLISTDNDLLPDSPTVIWVFAAK